MVQAAVQLIRRPTALAAVTSLALAACVPPDFGTPPPPARTATAPAPAAPAPKPAPPVGPPQAAGSAEPSPPAAVAPAPTPVRTAPPVSAAGQALLEESRSYQAAGKYEQAAAAIERALRIEPRQPALWLELGTIRLQEGDFAQAESLGRKALSLSAGDAVLSARAERLIADARQRQK